MGLPLVVETGDSVGDGTGESVGIGEGSVGELMLLEVAPASLDVIQLGAYFGSHSRVSQGRWAIARVVSLLRWIGPLSRTATRGRVRSVVPYAVPSWSSRAIKSVERLVGLVCTRRRRCTGSKAPSIARFFA